MKKFFLILLIMSFMVGSIWAQKNATTIRLDSSDKEQLPERPDLNRTYNWQAYAVSGEETNLNWPVPERATFFEIWDFCLSGPVTIEQVSHLFYEHTSYPWPDSTFHFKIYDADGTTLLHESGDLEAANYVEYFYTLPTPLVVTDDFWVAVVPTDVSGHPSSMSTTLHDGHSYNGSAGDFLFYPGFEYITGVYIEGTDTGARTAVTPDVYAFGVVPLGETRTMTFVIENYCPTGEITFDPAPDLTGDAVFTITSDNGAPYPTIVPTDQTTIEVVVEFAPTAALTYNTTLSVYDNLTDNTTAINISGIGLLPDCDWYIIGYDSYGDGWNGGEIDIVIDGIPMYNWTGPVTTGPDTLTFGIIEGGVIDLIWTMGSYDSEITYDLYNNFDVIVFSDGPNPVGTTGIPGTCVAPTCPPPTNLFTDGISRTRANLNWTAGGIETYWNVLWGLTGTFTPGTGGTLIADITSIPQELTSLTAATGYDWYVQADCDGPGITGNESDWVGPISFSTVYDTPFTEDFEGSVAGWTMGGTLPSWEIDSPGGLGVSGNPDPATAHGGTKCAGTDLTDDGAYNSSEISYLTSPILDCSALTTVALTFWRYLNVENSYDEVYVEVTNDNGATWNDLGHPLYVQETAWTEIIFSATAYAAGEDVQFRWRIDTDSSVNYTGWNIDDITVEESAICWDPSDLITSNITNSSANLNWTANGTELYWNVEWDTTGFVQGTGNMVSTDSNPYPLTGLTTATTYDWYVQADCSTTRDSSNWIGPITFTTLCDANVAYPFIENFDALSTVPDCWIIDPVVSGDSWEVFSANPGHGAPSDHTTGTGNFMGVDDSSPETVPAHLYSYPLDLTGLPSPLLEFYYWIGDAATDSELHIDIDDGTTVTTDVGIYTATIDHWAFAQIDLSAFT